MKRNPFYDDEEGGHLFSFQRDILTEKQQKSMAFVPDTQYVFLTEAHGWVGIDDMFHWLEVSLVREFKPLQP